MRPLDRQSRGEQEAALGAGPGGHLAAVDLDALADADETVTGAVVRRGALAVVADLDLDMVGPVADGDVGLAGMRVLERVGEPLLHDPIGGEVDRAREREGLALHVKLDWEAGAAELVEQRVEAVEARLGAERDAVAFAAHRAEQAAHLRQCRAAGLLDAPQCLPVLGVRFGQPVADCAYLEHHHAHRVSDDVV